MFYNCDRNPSSKVPNDCPGGRTNQSHKKGVVIITIRFIKHWKKNYYDNAGHVPQYYCDEEVALNISPPTIRSPSPSLD